jgi:hypothetical protein
MNQNAEKNGDKKSIRKFNHTHEFFLRAVLKLSLAGKMAATNAAILREMNGAGFIWGTEYILRQTNDCSQKLLAAGFVQASKLKREKQMGKPPYVFSITEAGKAYLNDVDAIRRALSKF